VIYPVHSSFLHSALGTFGAASALIVVIKFMPALEERQQSLPPASPAT
jgi:hypothetical protein